VRLALRISGKRHHADVIVMRMRMLAVVILAVAAIAPVSSFSEDKPGPGSFDRKQNALPPEVKKILDTADRFILLSLDPKLMTEQKPDKPSNELFHNYRVRRKIEIRTRNGRDELLRALYKGIADSDGSFAMCFNPRHGIRASMGDETVDVVICFECSSIQIHGKTDGELLTSGSPASTFTRALKLPSRRD